MKDGKKIKCGSHQKKGGKWRKICNKCNKQKGCKNKDCKFLHCCDVLRKSEDAVCGGTSHTREEHTGERVEV